MPFSHSCSCKQVTEGYFEGPEGRLTIIKACDWCEKSILEIKFIYLQFKINVQIALITYFNMLILCQ